MVASFRDWRDVRSRALVGCTFRRSFPSGVESAGDGRCELRPSQNVHLHLVNGQSTTVLIPTFPENIW